MLTSYYEEIQSRGFAIIPAVLDSQVVADITEQLACIKQSDSTKQRGSSYFGIRNLLSVVPALQNLVILPVIRSLVDPIVGPQAKAVRGLFFDKTPEANWKVPWHQDLTIAVRERKEVAGFTGWSMKAGSIHAQPPSRIMNEMLALRLHLDAANEQSGALKVIPGSHTRGRLSAEDMHKIREETKSVICLAESGDVVAMRPLLLHSSSVSTNASHRRVIHLEFCSLALPGGLEWCQS